jgi:hypothetical protein
MPTEIQEHVFHRLLSNAPQSIDAEARTAKVVWSTGAPVQRQDFQGPYVEVLSMARDAVDLSRLSGAPVLNSHRSYGVEGVLGVTEDPRLEDGRGTATIRFSERKEVEPIFQDVRTGIIRQVSAGYTVQRWEISSDPKTGARVKTATRWTPYEISLVPVAADPGATVRSHKEAHMTGQTTTVETATPNPVPAAPAAQQQPPAGDQTRAQINAEVRSIAAQSGLGDDFANRFIDAQQAPTLDQVRAAAFTALQERSQGVAIQTNRVIQIGRSADDPETLQRNMGEALFSRISPSHKLSEPARPYAYLSMPEIAKEVLRVRGFQITGISAAELVTRALNTTSDFPIIMGNTVGRTLRQAYAAAPTIIKQLAREMSAPDFRARQRIMLGEAPSLEKVNEAGEFKSGSMAEAKESYKLDTYGKIIKLSRQLIINDDLGAFSDLSGRLGIAVAGWEAQMMVDLLISQSGTGPNMDDGNPLFHTSHKNVAGSGGAIAENTLTAARLAMRKQTGLSGGLIDVTPKNLLVPPDLETTAEKQLAAIAAAKTSDVNPYANKLTLLVENRLTSATRWYITADPAQVEGLIYCYLEGQAGPQIETKAGFEVDGVQVKVREDFGTAFVESRSWYMNPGA